MNGKDKKGSGDLADWANGSAGEVEDKETRVMPPEEDEEDGQDGVASGQNDNDLDKQLETLLDDNLDEDQKKEAKPKKKTGSTAKKKASAKDKNSSKKTDLGTWIKNAKLPQGIYALFLLIDIGGPAKKFLRLPWYFHLEKVKTLIGRYSKALVHLDDPETVEVKHAKVTYGEKNGRNVFTLCPIEFAEVTKNSRPVPDKGTILENGDLVGIGSAQLIFFHKEVKED